jgi:hypothetical protein
MATSNRQFWSIKELALGQFCIFRFVLTDSTMALPTSSGHQKRSRVEEHVGAAAHERDELSKIKKELAVAMGQVRALLEDRDEKCSQLDRLYFDLDRVRTFFRTLIIDCLVHNRVQVAALLSTVPDCSILKDLSEDVDGMIQEAQAQQVELRGVADVSSMRYIIDNFVAVDPAEEEDREDGDGAAAAK